MLTIHVEAWILRCQLINEPKNTIIENTMVSFEKQSLVLTVTFFYSKNDTLPATKQKWFEHDESEYSKLLVKTIKQ